MDTVQEGQGVRRRRGRPRTATVPSAALWVLIGSRGISAAALARAMGVQPQCLTACCQRGCTPEFLARAVTALDAVQPPERMTAAEFRRWVDGLTDAAAARLLGVHPSTVAAARLGGASPGLTAKVRALSAASAA